MISFNLTALTQPTLSIQRKSKTRHIFPRKTLQNFTQLSFILSVFNKNSRFTSKLSLFNHGTETFQEKSLRTYDYHIPYRRRWRAHGNGADISLKRWERIFDSQHNSRSPTWMHSSWLDQPVDSLTIGTTVKYGRRDHRLPANPKHVYNLCRRRPNEPRSNNWKPWSIYASDPTQTPSPNTTLPTCATYPRYAAISNPGRSWAVRRLLSRQYPTTQPPQYCSSSGRLAQPNITPSSAP